MKILFRSVVIPTTAFVVTSADLVVLDADTLSKFRNFGKKSMDELNELMERLGLTFGMDVSKYNLDND